MYFFKVEGRCEGNSVPAHAQLSRTKVLPLRGVANQALQKLKIRGPGAQATHVLYCWGQGSWGLSFEDQG
jgi:hypothetical protein